MLVKSQVKYIQSLGQKKFRDQEGAFVAEGPKIVKELLTAPNLTLVTLYALKEWLADARSEGIPIPSEKAVEVREQELGRLSALATPNQAVAIFRKPFSGDPDGDAAPAISLLLDSIQDPGNLGTIVRIADWFGVRRIICSPDSADIFSTKAVQSTMGSIGRVQVDYEDPAAFLARYPGIPVYATALGGESVYRMGRIGKGIIVIGNESRGIQEELLHQIPHHITIPRIGQAESLNAAVAAGIVLSHLVGAS